MSQASIHSLSPLDGRYQNELTDIASLFCEKSLIWHRLYVEIEWLKCLAQNPNIPECQPLSSEVIAKLDKILKNFSNQDALSIKQIETEISHDVKAVEVFLGNQLDIDLLKPWIHFGCTSEDINNTAYACILKKAMTTCITPTYIQITSKLIEIAKHSIDTPMLSLTHGQPASPTTFGKEMAVFINRVARPILELKQQLFMAKFNGAVGNFNAHQSTYPNVNWWQISKDFVEKQLGLTWNPVTTQIEPHDYIANILNNITEINCILLDLSQDCWSYISRSYLILEKNNALQVGSSTMPHKINPIQFENAEGNFGLNIALGQHLATKLTRSRLQRDLSDSTVMRNIGTCLGYSTLACQQLLKGLNKIKPNQEKMLNDLNEHWEVLAEPIQTILRKHGDADAYTTMKQNTQGKHITKEDIHNIISSSSLPEEQKQSLLKLEPKLYIGESKHALEYALNAVAKVIDINCNTTEKL